MKTIKCVLVGSLGAGKTSIVESYKKRTSVDFIPSTIGVQFSQIKFDKYNVNIWDTAGEERFRCIIPMYYRNAKVCLIIIDLMESTYVNNITYWYDIISKGSLCTIIMVGNKCDMVSDETIDIFINKCKELNTMYATTSIYDIETLENLFNNKLTSVIDSLYTDNNNDDHPNLINLINTNQTYTNCCYN